VPPMVVAIDGPAGSGKSTVATMLARVLGVPMLSTGVFFRIVAWGLTDAEPADEVVDAFFDTHTIEVDQHVGRLDGVELTEELRSQEVRARLSILSANPLVRRHVLALERLTIERMGACVVEGRDIGSVVWPDADCKFFLIARRAVRVERRPEEGQRLFERDHHDSTRFDAPLAIADDAFIVDNSDEGVEALVGRMHEVVRLRSGR